MYLETATVKQRVHLSPEHPDNFWRQSWSSYSSLDKKKKKAFRSPDMEFFSRSLKMDSHQYKINLSCVWSNVVSTPLCRALLDHSTVAESISGISNLELEKYGKTNSPLSEKKGKCPLQSSLIAFLPNTHL